MDMNDVKQIVGEKLIPLGFRPVPRKRLFIKDCGFYLILAETAPLRREGFHFDIGVMFLWTNNSDLVYDYACDDTRINAKGDLLGAVWFDDSPAVWDAKVDQILDEAIEKIEIYQQIADMAVLKNRLENRKDFTKLANPGFENRDISLAIAKMYTGEKDRAAEILAAAAQKNSAAAELYKCCDNQALFHNTLIQIVNRCRSRLAGKCRITLAPIAEI